MVRKYLDFYPRPSLAARAEFFMKYLLDGDAASNTLSWRWVAGIQTKGKHYIARPSNISKFTDGRFHPKGLNTVAESLNGEKEYLKEPLNLTFNETKKITLW